SEYQLNTDADEVQSNFANAEGSAALFELRDYWENPLVYVNLSVFDAPPGYYGGAAPTILRVRKGDGTDVEVDLALLRRNLTDPDTQQRVAKGFVIWSFGPDGINDHGLGDDITSWPKLDLEVEEQP